MTRAFEPYSASPAPAAPAAPPAAREGAAGERGGAALLEAFMEWRGIEKLCERCEGSGSRCYATTAVWRGGVGGASLTVAVCDACWGSGDAERPWANLRLPNSLYEAGRNKSTLDDLLRRLGGGRAEDVLALAVVLRKIDGGAARRTSPGFWVRHLAGWLGEELATIAKAGAK